MTEALVSRPDLPQLIYSPEVEERRSDYEKLAECFEYMLELSCGRPGVGLLDVESEPNDEGNVETDRLKKSIESHFADLWVQIDWLNPLTMRKFYAEMRLYADQLALDRERKPTASL